MNLDLKNNKYDYKTLKENIYALDLFEILDTQILTIEFVVKYILNSNYQLTEKEELLNIEYVLNKQPHIDREKLLKVFNNTGNDDDNDSFTCFDDYAFSKS